MQGVSEDEDRRLARLAGDSWYAKGVNAEIVRYTAEIFARHWRGRRCLELGPAEGLMTETLAATFPELTCVEGAASFVASLRARFPKARVVQALFEDFATDERFDAIVLGHVLEHVTEPRRILERCRGWLAPGGAVYAAVPNARSIHRQAGVLMGMLAEEHALNETDHKQGHRRVYDPESFRADFHAAGLAIRVFGGYFLKLLSNAQIDAACPPALVRACMQLGERYPDIAADLYVIADAGDVSRRGSAR